MFSGLSLEQAPPFKLPLIFFITAILFAICAGVMLFFIDIEIIDFKFISFLHLITIGFFGMIMVGALFQMLPVITGVVYKSLFFSNTVFMGFIIGIVTFIYGFLSQNFEIFILTKIAFFASIYLFSIVSIFKLFNNFQTSTTKNITLSLFSFVLSASFGILLLLIFQGVGINLANLKQIHLFFAYFGWIFLLILGVSFQVVPMFWVTKAYPSFCREYIGYLIFISLVLFAFNIINIKIFSIIIFISLLAYIAVTFLRFRQRKRKIPDISINFWQIGLFSLILAITLLAYISFVDSNLDIFVAFLFAYFSFSVIIAMLYKIIPFLAWFHLSSKGIFNIPTMKEMIPQHMDKIHLYLHILLFIVGLISFFTLKFVSLFAILFVISLSILFFNIISISKHYFSNISKFS